MRHGGQILIDQLKIQGVERVFCVPGESYLAALDGLYDSGIDTVIGRQEGGARCHKCFGWCTCSLARQHADDSFYWPRGQ